jgi:hypothetical protein
MSAASTPAVSRFVLKKTLLLRLSTARLGAVTLLPWDPF